MGASFAAGSLAGVAEAVAIVTPQETLKTKLIKLNMPMVQGAAHIIKMEGAWGLYQGLISTCLKQGEPPTTRRPHLVTVSKAVQLVRRAVWPPTTRRPQPQLASSFTPHPPSLKRVRFVRFVRFVHVSVLSPWRQAARTALAFFSCRKLPPEPNSHSCGLEPPDVQA